MKPQIVAFLGLVAVAVCVQGFSLRLDGAAPLRDLVSSLRNGTFSSRLPSLLPELPEGGFAPLGDALSTFRNETLASLLPEGGFAPLGDALSTFRNETLPSLLSGIQTSFPHRLPGRIG
nr:uncharacterized protein LOC113827809 isoform X1 [Penaeus vannamei]